MKVKILDRYWKIYKQPDKRFEREHEGGHQAAALCFQEERKIYVKKSFFTRETITHELVHAYCSELALTELNLDEDQIEEFFCELLARHGDAILSTTDQVFGRLKGKV